MLFCGGLNICSTARVLGVKTSINIEFNLPILVTTSDRVAIDLQKLVSTGLKNFHSTVDADMGFDIDAFLGE